MSRPKTTKTPPTMAQMLMMNLERGWLDFVIDMETGENSKIIMTILSSGYSSAGFLFVVKA